MAKNPRDLFNTPAIGTEKPRINEPQRDAKRGSVAPAHKEKPLINRPKQTGTSFRGDINKEIASRFEKNPDDLISVEDLKRQYGDNPRYSWDTLPGNKITQNGKTYLFQNAKDLDKRIAQFEIPYAEKLYDRFGEFGYDDNLKSVYDSIGGKNLEYYGKGGTYTGKGHILSKIRDLKSDPRNENLSDQELLKLAVENAQIDYDDATELPFTRKQWDRIVDDSFNGKQGMDDWDYQYNKLYDAIGDKANAYNNLLGSDWDDEYLYGIPVPKDWSQPDRWETQEDTDRAYPLYRFKSASEEPQPLTWDEYYAQNPGADTYDFLEHVYYNGGQEMPDLFTDAVYDALNSGNVTNMELANAIYEIDDGLLYDVFDDIRRDATEEAVEEASNSYWDYYSARRYLEDHHPYIDSSDIEDLLAEQGLYSDERIGELIGEIADDWGYEPGVNDLDDIAENIRDELYSQYNVDLDVSTIEDYLSDMGYSSFDIDDFSEWLLNQGSDVRNADRTVYDILANYGGKEPEELWDRYIESLTNAGGYANIPYRGPLDQWYGRDFAKWTNRDAKDIRNWYARRPEEYGKTPADFIEAIDEAPTFRKQVQVARQLVENGDISEEDAILYLTSYTSLWKDGLLSARAQEIIEEEWNKAEQKSKELLNQISDVKE